MIAFYEVEEINEIVDLTMWPNWTFGIQGKGHRSHLRISSSLDVMRCIEITRAGEREGSWE